MKYMKLKEDWTVVLELLRQHQERTAALLVSKKASQTFFLLFFCKKIVINSFIGILYDRRMIH